MITIEEKSGHTYALHHLGFRPFFLLASLFGVTTIAAWAWLYHNNLSLPVIPVLPAATWHGHEMIYGYGFAVTAGFLLTAVKNWTGIQTLHGPWLILLASMWLLARIMPLSGHASALVIMAILDISFDFLLCLAIVHPIAGARQWRQLPIWACLLGLMLANLWFYISHLDNLAIHTRKSLYLGMYILILLISLMGRRVIPFFIEKSTGQKPTNFRFIDIAALSLLPVFIILEVFSSLHQASHLAALLLAVLHGIRLAGWYTGKIFSNPMLWILYIGYGWIVLGFLLKALTGLGTGNPMLSFHAFGYGAIGTLTLGMMSRVALGHTGRDINQRRPALTVAFAILVMGAIFRVLLPIFVPSAYTVLIGLSQGAWILAFGIFFWVFSPILIRARVDGRYG